LPIWENLGPLRATHRTPGRAVLACRRDRLGHSIRRRQRVGLDRRVAERARGHTRQDGPAPLAIARERGVGVGGVLKPLSQFRTWPTQFRTWLSQFRTPEL